MRTVFTNDMVAHVWAHQGQAEGRNANGSFYFQGDTIYSYGGHFPVARIVCNEAGERLALFNSGSYSMTTAKHQSLARRAIPDGLSVVYVAHIDCSRHSDNVAELVKRAGKSFLSATRARKNWSKESHYQEGLHTAKALQAYGAFFGVDVPDLKPENAAAECARLERAAREEKAKREAAKAAGRAERITKWRAGGEVMTWDCPVALRLSADGETVQTSKGAEIPTEHARLLWKVWRRCIDRGEAYQRNGHTIHVGHFAVDSISAKGDLVAGCHNIARAELERMAGTLGLQAPERVAA